MSNHASKVFAVPELLEAILLKLPPRDLLLAQRVDKTFRESINTSVRIQQKLFFQASSKRHDDGSSDLNPFLGRIISLSGRSWSMYVVTEIETRWLKSGSSATTTTETRVGGYGNSTAAAPCTLEDNQHILLRNLSADYGCYVDISKESEHSWQKMLVTDPPRFVNLIDATSLLTYRDETITPESMGDLMEALDKNLIRGGPFDEDEDDMEEWGSDEDDEDEFDFFA